MTCLVVLDVHDEASLENVIEHREHGRVRHIRRKRDQHVALVARRRLEP